MYTSITSNSVGSASAFIERRGGSNLITFPRITWGSISYWRRYEAVSTELLVMLPQVFLCLNTNNSVGVFIMSIDLLVDELSLAVDAFDNFCSLMSCLKDPVNIGEISALIYLLTRNLRDVTERIQKEVSNVNA